MKPGPQFSSHVVLRRYSFGPLVAWEQGRYYLQQTGSSVRLQWKVEKSQKSVCLGSITIQTNICEVGFVTVTNKIHGISIEDQATEIVFCAPDSQTQMEMIQTLLLAKHEVVQWVTCNKILYNICKQRADSEENEKLLQMIQQAKVQRDVSCIGPKIVTLVQNLVSDSAKLSSVLLKAREESTIQRNGNLLGSGGFASVMSGEWKNDMGEYIPVAIKQIHSELNPVTSPFDLTAFRREITILELMQHPNLLSYHAYSFNSPFYFIVTELASCTLREYVQTSQELSGEIKVFLARQLCLGVAELHRCNIAHRDLKSENILLVLRDGEELPEVKIADFGISRVQSVSDKMMCTQAVGTMNYMAPEFLNATGMVDADCLLPSDLFSIAHVIYAIFEQKEPHIGRSLVQIVKKTESGTPLSIQSKDFPRSWVPIIKKCWALSPSARPSIAELCDVIIFNHK